MSTPGRRIGSLEAMSATNIQWITIAVLGFGAVFAFFVLVFVFEATVHALRYRDQYAGGGGGFRMPSFGGRQAGGFGSGEPTQSPRSVRQRDPQVNRALAREAARIAADERIRSGEVRLKPVPNDQEEPAPAAVSKEAEVGDEPIEIAAAEPASEVVDLSPQLADVERQNTPSADDPLVAAEPEPFDGFSVEQASDQAADTGADLDPTVDEDDAISAPSRPLVAEPLVLTAKHEVTLDTETSKPKAGRVTMRALKGPLIAAQSSFRRHSGKPARADRDGELATPPLSAPEPGPANIQTRQPEKTARTTSGLPEQRLSELHRAEVDRTAPQNRAEEPASAPRHSATQTMAEAAPESQIESRTVESVAPESATAPTPQTTDVSAPEPETVAPTANTDVLTDSAPDPVSTVPVAPASEAPASEARAPQVAAPEAVTETRRPSKVAQPSQPESEVMADTTRQLKSLRDAEQFGGGPQTGEASCPLYLRYRSASGIIFDRIVQAVTLEEADGEWIMRAFCHRSKAMRRIRVSNVVAAFDLRNRDVSVGGKVTEFLRDRVPLRDSSGQSKPSEGGASPAAAE